MKNLFTIEKNPHRGLFAFEWVVVAYMLLTLVVILFVAAGLSLFFICRQILGTSKNLGTVVAVLLTLPGAKALVNLILFLP